MFQDVQDTANGDNSGEDDAVQPALKLRRKQPTEEGISVKKPRREGGSIEFCPDEFNDLSEQLDSASDLMRSQHSELNELVARASMGIEKMDDKSTDFCMHVHTALLFYSMGKMKLCELRE